MGFLSDLGSGPVGIDTSICIYFIEQDARYIKLLRPLFQEADRGATLLVASAIALLEVLVLPYRAGNTLLAHKYESLLTNSRALRLVPCGFNEVRMAARLRALTNLKTPDAIHLASAMIAGCATFLTNDRALAPIPGLRIVQLSDYARV